MTWDFLPPELREKLRAAGVLDKGDELVARGEATREQVEAMMSDMLEVAAAAQRGAITEDQGRRIVEWIALNRRRA